MILFVCVKSALRRLLILVSSQKIERSRTAITNSKNWTIIFSLQGQGIGNVRAFYSLWEGFGLMFRPMKFWPLLKRNEMFGMAA